MSSFTDMLTGAIASEMAPFLDTPSAAPSAPSRPTPGGMSNQGFPMPAPRPSTTVTEDGTVVAQSSVGMGMGGDDSPFTTIDNIEFGGVTAASAINVSSMYDRNSNSFRKSAVKEFGFGQTYNPRTGLMSTGMPNLGRIGPIGALFNAIGSFATQYNQGKQQEAMQKAGLGLKDNGVITIAGQRVAIVDGKLYGNLPEGVSIGQIKEKALQVVNNLDIRDKAGVYAIQPTGYDESGITGSRTYTAIDDTSFDRNAVGRDAKDVDSDDYYSAISISQSEGESNENSGGGVSFGGGGGSYSGGSSYGDSDGRALGGRIGMANGSSIANAGFVQGPPSEFTDEETIADTEETSVAEGTFIINAPAVEIEGSDNIRAMLVDAYNIAVERGLDTGSESLEAYESEVDVALSKGEVIVPPVLAEIIGYERLEEINNKGKPEVTNRQEMAAKGGFIGGYANGGDVVEGMYGGVEQLTDIASKFKKRYPNPKAARKDTAKLLKDVPPEDILAVLMMGEATILGDAGMKGVAHVTMNRVNSDLNDFKDVQSVYDAAMTKTNSGIFQFNALEPTRFRSVLKDITGTEYGRNMYQRIRGDAEEILSGVQDDFTKGSLFFWNPETSTDSYFKNKVSSGEWEPQAETRTNLAYHQYLRPKTN